MERTENHPIPKVESTEDVKNVYEQGQKYNNGYQLQPALDCYLQVFGYIQSLDDPESELKHYQSDTCLHICDIYIRKGNWNKADEFYLKVDSQNQPSFEGAQSEPFTYQGKSKPVKMSYWKVPAGVFSDQQRLIDWSTDALAAAKRAKKK